MKRMNKFMAMMIVAAVATISTPQVFAAGAVAIGDRTAVAIGDRSAVAIGDRSAVAIGDRSAVAIGDFARIALGQLAAGIIMTD